MRQIKKLLWLAFILLPIVVPATSLHATLRSDVPGSDVPDPKETVLVGRIGFAGDTSYRKQTNNEGRLFH